MNLRCVVLTLTAAAACNSPAGLAATIGGTVKGPEGSALKGVFVQAQDGRTHISYIGLSDPLGRYRLQNLPAGEYQLSTRAAGYSGDPVSGVRLVADQAASRDLSLRRTPVRWNEISIYQAGKLWPASPAKDKVFSTCFTCHGFQTRMATVRRNADEWLGRVQFMQGAMHFGLGDRLDDQDVRDIAAYLHSLYGEKSVLPESPQDSPSYRDTVRPFSDEALNISYVEYDLPQQSSMPFSAAPDGNGHLWIPEFGIANRIGRLDPKSGEFEEFTAPNVGTAAIHSAVPAADGTVWLTEQGSNKLGQWDPQSRRITEFQDAYLPGKLGYGAGSKHTLRFDGAGNVWSSGAPLTMLDRKTGKFTRFDSIPSTYDVKEDKDGNIWFTKPDTSSIGRVDVKTLKISVWTPPTPHSFPRRMEIDDDGIVWFGEYNAGKVGRFDPKTEKFTEYPLPGPAPTPYGFGIDAEHRIWYSSYEMDVIGRFDPKTGRTVEYPFPHAENTIREFIRDAQGRMWYGTPSNNRVGYIRLNQGSP